MWVAGLNLSKEDETLIVGMAAASNAMNQQKEVEKKSKAKMNKEIKQKEEQIFNTLFKYMLAHGLDSLAIEPLPHVPVGFRMAKPKSGKKKAVNQVHAQEVLTKYLPISVTSAEGAKKLAELIWSDAERIGEIKNPDIPILEKFETNSIEWAQLVAQGSNFVTPAQMAQNGFQMQFN